MSRINVKTKIVFCWHLEGQWRKKQDPDPDPLVRGMDPRIRIRIPLQNVMDPEHWSEVSCAWQESFWGDGIRWNLKVQFCSRFLGIILRFLRLEGFYPSFFAFLQKAFHEQTRVFFIDWLSYTLWICETMGMAWFFCQVFLLFMHFKLLFYVEKMYLCINKV